jgi:hypothetical protein
LFHTTQANPRRRVLFRDRTANAALRVAKRIGLTVNYQNPGEAAVEVYAISEGGAESLGLTGGETATTRFTVWIPRQELFPPTTGFLTGATVWVDGVAYAPRVSYDAEHPKWAPVFRFDLERYDLTVEYDGRTAP